jgi:hypothetical protein
MPNPENVKGKAWKKGQSGNPNGRPKKLPQIEKLLAEVLGEKADNGPSGIKQILTALKRKAAKGDTRAAELILDRAYGKAKQKVEVDIPNEVKFVIRSKKPRSNDQADGGNT